MHAQRHAALMLGAFLVASAPPAAAQDAATAAQTGESVIRLEVVRAELTALAHDSMEGRATGTEGARRAARYIAGLMRQIGLEPAGDDGYLQRVPLARPDPAAAGSGRGGRGGRMTVLSGMSALDTIPAERRVIDANVVGVIRGSDPALRAEAVVVGAHYDHTGIGRPVDGDSIYNGADDDASGVIAVLEIARALAAGPAPKRTVLFVAFTGEERGLLGTNYYLANPVIPLDRTVAQLQIEMIGRPDSLAGGAGKGWLTGYERSTMGDVLRDHGIPIVPDPRPEQSFFTRSDNIAFAYAGIPAHTLSSFNLHDDYHRPSDEVSGVDFEHMTEVIRAAARAVRLLADGARPAWHEGGRPERNGRGRGSGSGIDGNGSGSGERG